MNSNIKPPAKIISPKTGRSILVNGDAYKKLLKEGYTEEELLKKSISNKLLPIPKSPAKSKTNEDYRIGFTGKVDTDKYLIDQLDLKDLLQFYQTDKYIRNLIDNDKRLKELIRLLNQGSVYNSETKSFDFKDTYSRDKMGRAAFYQTEITDYTLKLLEERKINEVMKIIDFYEPKDNSYIDYHNAYNDYFYGRLFYEIIGSDLIDLSHTFEDYFSIAPNDVDWSFLEDVLESPLQNWDYPDIFKLITKLLKSSEITRKNKLFDQIVSIWNSWYDSLKEVMIEDGNLDDLKLFDDLQKLIDNHYKK